MTRDPLRRAAVSALLGAPLPLAFIGSLLMQGEPHLQYSDRAAFYILLPALLFGMMAFAIWILMRRSAGSMRR
jgi:hypothetical protein